MTDNEYIEQMEIYARELHILREALAYYADKENYITYIRTGRCGKEINPNVLKDGGQIARDVLGL